MALLGCENHWATWPLRGHIHILLLLTQGLRLAEDSQRLFVSACMCGNKPRQTLGGQA